MVITLRSNTRGVAGRENEGVFIDPQHPEGNIGAGDDRVDPPLVNDRDRSPQRTRGESSESSERNGGEAARIAELEGQLEDMRALLKDIHKSITPGQGSAAESADNRRVTQEVSVIDNQKGSSYKTFLSCKPPAFKGGEDPLVCRRWVRKMEQTFSSAVFSEKQKVCYAVRMLEEEALDWWESVDQTLSELIRDSLTWALFVEKLNSRFCSEGAMQRNQREFLNLKKGCMTVAKYNTTFTDKLQFARHHCPTERSLVSHYVEGLPYPYRSSVRSQTTLEMAMEEARRVEDDLAMRDSQERGSEKRKWEGPSGSPFKKSNINSRKGDQEEKSRFCYTCFSSHQGLCSKHTMKCKRCGKVGHTVKDCRTREVICYNCQEMGHIASHCTKPRAANPNAGRRDEIPRPKGRAFQMNAEEARRNDEVIFGTFVVNSLPANVLFDFGTSRSFVSTEFSAKLDVPRSLLEISSRD